MPAPRGFRGVAVFFIVGRSKVLVTRTLPQHRYCDRSKEGAAHNVRSHVVCPGFVRTPLVNNQIPEQARELGLTEDEVIRNVMLGGTVDGVFTTVEDIAQTTLFLAAFPTAALTGQSVVVSHGWYMQ